MRTKEKSSDAALSPMFPANKAVQPCLARQADIRPAISFDSPATLPKFVEHEENRPVERAIQMAAVDRGQEPLTGRSGHDRDGRSHF